MNVSIFTAKAQLASFLALFQSAGIDLEALLAKNDPNALKAHLDAHKTGAASEITAETPAVAALIKSAVEAHNKQVINQVKDLLSECGINSEGQTTTIENLFESAGNRITEVISAFSSAGVKIEASASSADIAKAINARISTKAAEMLASHGTPPVDNSPSASPAAAKPAPAATGHDGREPTGIARTAAAFKGKIPVVK